MTIATDKKMSISERTGRSAMDAVVNPVDGASMRNLLSVWFVKDENGNTLSVVGDFVFTGGAAIATSSPSTVDAGVYAQLGAGSIGRNITYGALWFKTGAAGIDTWVQVA